MAEKGKWSGDAGADRDLGSTSRAARQKVQDGRWRPAGWKLLWSGGPRQKQGCKIVCKRAVQLRLRVAGGRGNSVNRG